MRIRLSSAVVLLALMCTLTVSRGQAPTFDAASVKPNHSGQLGGELRVDPGGRFIAVNVPLRAIIRVTYGVPDDRVVAPEWIASERYDIQAKAAGDPSRAVIWEMVKSLLADRFHAVIVNETREADIYSLVRADPDTLGPRLRRSRVDCAAIGEAAQHGVRPPPSDRVLCGGKQTAGHIEAGGMPMAATAGALSQIVGRPVVDATKLDGQWDYELDYTPPQPAPAAAVLPPPLDTPPPSPTDAPSIFTALKEQLGLRLEAGRGPVEVVVVRSIDRPTSD